MILTIWKADIRSRCVGVVSGSAALLLLGGAAGAVTDTDFIYKSAKTGFYSIAAFDMIADGPGPGGDYFINYDNLTLEGNGCYNTGVHIPSGAKIIDLTVYLRSDNLSNMSVVLKRQTLTTGVVRSLVDETINNDANARTSVTIPVPAGLSLNGDGIFTYGFAVCINTGTTFSGARVKYTYRSAGD